MFGGKVVPVREELKLRCLRFHAKFLGNWGVSTERSHMKHTFESVSPTYFSEGKEAEHQNLITFRYQRAGNS